MCKSAFDATCYLMEEKLAYSGNEQVSILSLSLITLVFFSLLHLMLLADMKLGQSVALCFQDMVLLHHEVEVEYPESKRIEKHSATLLEFGDIKNGQMTTAMAKTVGIPAAIGALVLTQTLITTFSCFFSPSKF